MLLRILARASLSLPAALLFAACSAPVGGPVDGPADTHCGKTVQATDPAVCMKMGTAPAEESNPVLYGTEGDDDDCKYHVTWSATDITENSDVTFTVVLTSKVDGKPVTGADPYAEVFLGTGHGAPDSGSKTTEKPAGTYQIGPIRFDEAGNWTVRFHFFHMCTDVDEATPHGHAAFYVNVP
jgi:hypothetical protein